jgi:hypothetical protein
MKRTAIKCYDENAGITVFGSGDGFELITTEYASRTHISVLLTPEEAEEIAYYILRRNREMKEESGQQLS